MRDVNIAIVGMGTVGGATIRLLDENARNGEIDLTAVGKLHFFRHHLQGFPEADGVHQGKRPCRPGKGGLAKPVQILEANQSGLENFGGRGEGYGQEPPLEEIHHQKVRRFDGAVWGRDAVERDDSA